MAAVAGQVGWALFTQFHIGLTSGGHVLGRKKQRVDRANGRVGSSAVLISALFLLWFLVSVPRFRGHVTGRLTDRAPGVCVDSAAQQV